MYSAKQKVKNMASAAKEHADNYQAKVEEKVEKASARTKEEKQIAEERRKVKEAEAKMHLHQAKAEHAAEKLHGKHSHHHHLYGQPAAGGVPVVGGAHTRHPVAGSTAANVPGTAYPPAGAGHTTGHHHHY